MTSVILWIMVMKLTYSSNVVFNPSSVTFSPVVGLEITIQTAVKNCVLIQKSNIVFVNRNWYIDT